jgi:hypothetical protein
VTVLVTFFQQRFDRLIFSTGRDRVFVLNGGKLGFQIMARTVTGDINHIIFLYATWICKAVTEKAS